MRKTWLITDTHLYHKNIIDFCQRPPDHEKRMDEAVKRNVRNIDVLIHLGDVCMGFDGDAHKDFIMQWPGTKILVRGNHDKQSFNWYMDHGWNFACDGLLVEQFGKRIYLSHKPAPLSDDWDVNIHGHFHNSGHHLGDVDGAPRSERHLLLAVEWTNYEPILLRRVIEDGPPTGKVVKIEPPQRRGNWREQAAKIVLDETP